MVKNKKNKQLALNAKKRKKITANRKRVTKKLTRKKIAKISKIVKKEKLGETSSSSNVEESNSKPIKPLININALKMVLHKSLQTEEAKDTEEATSSSSNSLRDKMKERLKAARFRYINEQMYKSQGKDAKKMFQDDPYSFTAYHEGYRQQVELWPINPLDVIIEDLKKMDLKEKVLADFGCGDGRLAKALTTGYDCIVHSFDLVSSSPEITACDMANCNLPSNSVNIAIYCLSLMGTNLNEYILEANRVLKLNGLMKIAEVESRFDKIETFVKAMEKFGFILACKDLSCELFYFLDFKKVKHIELKSNLPEITLKPCLYKKR